jgi:hypothetical protein
MDRDTFLHALQQELLRHNFDTFVDEPPSIAQGGRGVLVTGCVACRKRFQTMPQFMHHLAFEALPKFIAGVRPGTSKSS